MTSTSVIYAECRYNEWMSDIMLSAVILCCGASNWAQHLMTLIVKYFKSLKEFAMDYHTSVAYIVPAVSDKE